jgi:hypothetical protein
VADQHKPGIFPVGRQVFFPPGKKVIQGDHPETFFEEAAAEVASEKSRPAAY